MKQQKLIVPDRTLRQAPCAPRRSQKLTSKPSADGALRHGHQALRQ
ncbi:hypothetical protein A2U01_0102415, partial [Trifolium medium]|nr:hypothetical protein [Trifolium medium]